MRTVRLRLHVPHKSASDVYTTLANFELYPQLCDAVQSVVVTEVRGEGLLIGIDFVSPDAATEFLIGLLDSHVIPSYSLNSAQVLRLTPPAILDKSDLGWLERALISAAKHVARAMPEARPATVPSPQLA